MARIQGSGSQIRSRWRSIRARAAGCLAGAWVTAVMSAPSEQALRPPQQQQDGQRENEQRAALRQVELEREVEHADQERREEHAGDLAEPADRDHDQEIDQVFERVLRIEAEELGAEPAAERRHPAAEGEGEGEQPIDIDADRFGHAAVVDGGADLGADPGALESEPQPERDDHPDHDQEDAVGAVADEAEIDLSLQRRAAA